MGEDAVVSYDISYRLMGGCLYVDSKGAWNEAGIKYLLEPRSSGALEIEGWVC